MYFDSCVFDADSLEYTGEKSESPGASCSLGSALFRSEIPNERKSRRGHLQRGAEEGILGETAADSVP